jgi:hypothetical protein
MFGNAGEVGEVLSGKWLDGNEYIAYERIIDCTVANL